MRLTTVKILVTLLMIPSLACAASLVDTSYIDCSGKLTQSLASSPSINCGENLTINGNFKTPVNTDLTASTFPEQTKWGIRTFTNDTLQNANNLNSLLLFSASSNKDNADNGFNLSTRIGDASNAGSVNLSTGNWSNSSLTEMNVGHVEPVHNGTINLTPDLTNHNLEEDNVSLVGHLGNINSSGVGITIINQHDLEMGSNLVNVNLAHDGHFLNILNSKFTFLMENNDAEFSEGAGDDKTVVTLPNWTTEGNLTAVKYDLQGGLPTLTDEGPKDRGLNFFAGGPDNAKSSATRSVDVSALADGIDLNAVIFKLSGFFGGLQSQNDYAELNATFKDVNGEALKTVTVGGVLAEDRHDKTGLLYRKMSGVIPANTRSIQLTLIMTRLNGIYNDGYADNLALSISGSSGLVCPLVKSSGKSEKNCKLLEKLLADSNLSVN